MRLHPSNPCFSFIFVQGIGSEMLPPLEKHGLADNLKPRGELQVGLRKHLLEFRGRDVSRVPDFVGVDVEVHFGLDKENIIN